MTFEVGFHNGERVVTPGGPGRVQYCRMAPPDYRKVEAYSVLLDSKLLATQVPPFPNYSGTIYPADQVKLEANDDQHQAL